MIDGGNELLQRLEAWQKQYQSAMDQYQKESGFWARACMAPTDEMKNRLAFQDTFDEERARFRELFSDKGNATETHTHETILRFLGDADFKKEMQKRGLYQYALDVWSFDTKETPSPEKETLTGAMNDKEAVFRSTKIAADEQTFLIDNSLTADQQENLREIRKWMYEKQDPGTMEFSYLGSTGNHRNYVQQFMREPLAVQMSSIYLVNTRKRKEEDPLGTNIMDAQVEENTMDAKTFKKMMTQKSLKQFFTLSRTDGSHIYWDKLKVSVDKSKKNDTVTRVVNDFRKQQKIEAKRSGHPEGGKYSLFREKIKSNDKTEEETLEYLLKSFKEDGEKMREKMEIVKAIEDLEKFHKEKGIETGAENIAERKEKAYKDLYDSALSVKEKYENNIKGMTKVPLLIRTASKSADLYNMGFSAYGPHIYGVAEMIVENAVNISNKIKKNDKEFKLMKFLDDACKISKGTQIKMTGAYQLVTLSLGGLAATANLISGTYSVAKYHGLMSTSEKIEAGLGLSSATTWAASSAAGFTAYLRSFGKVSEKVAERSGLVARIGGVVTKTLVAFKNGAESIKRFYRRHKAQALQDRMETVKDKDIKASVKMTKKLNKHRAVKSTVASTGALAGVSVSIAAAIVAFPPLGIAAGVTAIASYTATKAVEKAAERNEIHTLGAKAADQLLAEKSQKTPEQKAAKVRTIDLAVGNYKKDRLSKQTERFDYDSIESKAIETMSEDEIKSQIRDEKAVENGAMNSYNLAMETHGRAMEKAFREVFLEKPEDGFIASNIRSAADFGKIFSKENLKAAREKSQNPGAEDDNLKKCREKINYYDLLAINGVKMKPSKQKTDEMKLASISKRLYKAQSSLSR